MSTTLEIIHPIYLNIFISLYKLSIHNEQQCWRWLLARSDDHRLRRGLDLQRFFFVLKQQTCELGDLLKPVIVSDAPPKPEGALEEPKPGFGQRALLTIGLTAKRKSFVQCKASCWIHIYSRYLRDLSTNGIRCKTIKTNHEVIVVDKYTVFKKRTTYNDWSTSTHFYVIYWKTRLCKSSQVIMRSYKVSTSYDLSKARNLFAPVILSFSTGSFFLKCSRRMWNRDNGVCGLVKSWKRRPAT